ncbi:hypothetical protein GLYMA_19G202951v4 [Glycine max]|nr:hypothetical protein GLYMA_19G202951v4 [Glycine max]KAH1078790.1 hypothetical protein GYH30_053689 [Glycine max]
MSNFSSWFFAQVLVLLDHSLFNVTSILPSATPTGLGVRNKGSTQYVVKGSQKEFPRELLQELKIVCQVQNSWLI